MVDDNGRRVILDVYRGTCLTVADVAAHVDRLSGLLSTERKKVASGHYRGDQQANENLIKALEGRITELRSQVTAAQAWQGQATTADGLEIFFSRS